MRREGGMELCCIAPGKQNVSRDSQQEFHHSYIIFWIIVVAEWLAHPIRIGAVRDRFPGGEFKNLLFNCFNGSNEGIIGGQKRQNPNPLYQRF